MKITRGNKKMWIKNKDGSETFIRYYIPPISKWTQFKRKVKEFIRKKITKKPSIADLF